MSRCGGDFELRHPHNGGNFSRIISREECLVTSSALSNYFAKQMTFLMLGKEVSLNSHPFISSHTNLTVNSKAD